MGKRGKGGAPKRGKRGPRPEDPVAEAGERIAQGRAAVPADPLEREIEVPVDMAEILSGGKAWLEAEDDRARLKAAVDDARKSLRVAAEEAERLARLHKHALRSGTKLVTVPVREVPDLEARVVRVYRADLDEGADGALIETRPMTAGEIQAGAVLTPSEAAETLAKVGALDGEDGAPAQPGFDFAGDDPPPPPVTDAEVAALAAALSH